MNIIWALIVFSLVVIIHEFGHFLLARRGGIKVLEFSLGMGPRLFSFPAMGTKFSLKLLPLGGSCLMEGEDGNSADPDAFSNKSVWTRMAVVVAGPFFNFILAFILSLFVIGFAGVDFPTVTSVTTGYPAAEAGIMSGDRITSFAGRKIFIGRDLSNYLSFHQITDKAIPVTYVRDGVKYETEILPKQIEIYQVGFSYMQTEQAAEIVTIAEGGALAETEAAVGDQIIAINGVDITTGTGLAAYLQEHPLDGSALEMTLKRGEETISITLNPKYIATSYNIGMGYNLARTRVGVLQTVLYSLNETRYWITSTIESLKQIILGKVSADDIAGPVGIVQMIGQTYEQSRTEGLLMVLLNMANISILISANLGVMNLLPIPALDGGRLIFLIIEAIRGKQIDPDKEGMVHLIGFALLMVLMVFIFYHDIMRILGR